jgi:hypothetical protein
MTTINHQVTILEDDNRVTLRVPHGTNLRDVFYLGGKLSDLFP